MTERPAPRPAIATGRHIDGRLVYAVGDIVRGASLVVWAIRDGREAADSILRRFDAAAAGIAAD